MSRRHGRETGIRQRKSSGYHGLCLLPASLSLSVSFSLSQTSCSHDYCAADTTVRDRVPPSRRRRRATPSAVLLLVRFCDRCGTASPGTGLGAVEAVSAGGLSQRAGSVQQLLCMCSFVVRGSSSCASCGIEAGRGGRGCVSFAAAVAIWHLSCHLVAAAYARRAERGLVGWPQAVLGGSAEG